MKLIARVILGSFLVFAGLSHLFWARTEFQAQVPTWVPIDTDFVVLTSGVVEIAGIDPWVVHFFAFFVAVFPGNISQFVTGTDAFGLDTDAARGIRLVFQPLLIIWALWCTDAWASWRTRDTTARQV